MKKLKILIIATSLTLAAPVVISAQSANTDSTVNIHTQSDSQPLNKKLWIPISVCIAGAIAGWVIIARRSRARTGHETPSSGGDINNPASGI